MSKFCTNCGNALEENVKFCTGCGKAVEAEPVVEETPAAPVVEEAPAPPAAEEAPAAVAVEAPAPAKAAPSFDFKKLLENKKMLAIAGAAVAVVVILLLVLTLGGGKGGGYMSAVDTYMDYTLGVASKSQLESLLPEEMWLQMQTYQEKPMEQLLETLMQRMENRAKQFEQEYGKKVKVDYEVIRDWTVSDTMREMTSAYLQAQYGFEEDCVSDIRKLELEATIGGTIDEETDEMEFYVLKIDGEWYLAMVYVSEGMAYVSFALN